MYETMARNSLLDRYKSISRPSSGGGGSSRFSSYIASLTKKQNAAEDAILDNQYSEGLITPENYLEALKTRSGRDYITPLQLVNLQEKMKEVGEKVTDTMVDRQYQAGTLTTAQVYEYEQNKLAKMTAIDSPTYQSQAQKVQELKDKIEKETRTNYRLQENLRISKLPEDTSASLWEKAKLYEKLESQARLDGDNSQALTYETTKNNYISSAKRADVNDIISGAKNTISTMTEGGLGVPNSEAGQAYYGKLTGSGVPVGTGTGVGVGNGGGGAGALGTNPGFISPAIKNAYEGLDRGQKTLDKLYNDLSQKELFIKKYDEAIGKASGDQKTQLVTARNNLQDSLDQTKNSIGLTEQNIQDTVIRIQELQQKAAASAFNQEVRKTNMDFDKKETEIEVEFSKGKINKQEYISSAAGLAKVKADYYSQASDTFNKFGNDVSAESYIQKSGDMASIRDNLVQVGNNIDDYEPIAVDPQGKIFNIFGKALKPGEFALTNMRREKDAETFDVNYVNKNGGYYKVYFPGLKDVNGVPYSGSLAREDGKLNERAFIYTTKDGKQVTESINYVTFTDETGKPARVKPVISSLVKDLQKKGVAKSSEGVTEETSFVVPLTNLNPDGTFNFTTPVVPEGTADKIYKESGKILNYLKGNVPKVGKFENGIWQPFAGFKPGFLETPIQKGKELLKGAQQGVGDFTKGAVKGVSDFLGGKYGVMENGIYQPFKKKVEGQTSVQPLNFVDKTIEKFFPKVYAAEVSKTAPVVEKKISPVVKTQVEKVLDSIPENQKQAATLIAKALKEQGILDPSTLAYALATAKHETAQSFQPVNEGFYNDEKYGYDPGFTGRSQARKLNYGGGEDYYGRGFIQLTHLGNYDKYGKQLGLDLVNNPELANDPEVAAKVLALYFKDRGTADLAKKGDFVGARGTINPDDKGDLIAGYAKQYLDNPFLMKSLISKVEAKDKPKLATSPLKNIVKPKIEEKNIFQKFSDFFIKPVSGQMRTPDSTVIKTGAIQTNPSSTLRSATQNQTNNNTQSSGGVQALRSASQIKVPSIPQISIPKIQTNLMKELEPKKVSQPSAQLQPKKVEQPKQNIVQQAVSKITNWFSNLFKKK